MAAAFCALALASAAGCGVRRTPGPLDRRITPRFIAESGPLELFAICSALGTPCGWEMLPSQARRRSEILENTLETDTGRSFLDRLVKRRPEYRWFMMGEVVNVAPTEIGANDPLDRQVWADIDGLSAEAALRKLVESAELKYTPRDDAAAGLFDSASFGRVSIKARGTRLRLALNRIVAADGRSMWWCAPTSDPDALSCGLMTWRASRRIVQ